MKTIGKYEVLGLLGRGGMGGVYKARLPIADKIVALKRLEPEETLEVILGTDELRTRFLVETHLIGSIQSPHIASVLDVDFDQKGRPFYAMEYYCINLGMLIGETFESEDPTRMLPVEESAHYARQVLQGLDRLHGEGIIHRDIKPFNVMVSPEDEVKLIDFGLSSLRGEVQNNPAHLKIGTPFYTAPEQEHTPEAADERADLFSVGVMLHRMITGQLPAERSKDRERVGSLNAGLFCCWDEFFEKALAHDPDKRFSSAKEMIAELDRVWNHWAQQSEQACVLLEDEECGMAKPNDVRSEPTKVSRERARDIFPVNELFQPDECWAHNFVDNGNGTVTDEDTGLVWQQSGCDYPLTYPRAKEYVAQLNQDAFAGADNWRLPTVDELISLLSKPFEPGADCVEPVFDTRCRNLWSADRKSFVAAWFVDSRMGFVSWQDFTCRFFAKAVRNLE